MLYVKFQLHLLQDRKGIHFNIHPLFRKVINGIRRDAVGASAIYFNPKKVVSKPVEKIKSSFSMRMLLRFA